MRVDLPAPFSPTMAWTSPRRTVRWTSLLATTPGKRLVMPVSTTAGGSSVRTDVELLIVECSSYHAPGPVRAFPHRARCWCLLGLRLVRDLDLALDDLGLVALEDA